LEFEEHIVKLMDKYDTLKQKNSKISILPGSSNFQNTKSLLPSAKNGQVYTSADTNKLFLQRIEDFEKFLQSVVLR
jgi:hypothetical protein